MREVSLLEFVAGKRAFYLDGKLYYFVEGMARPAGVRGVIHLADLDMETMKLVISTRADREPGQLEVPLDTPVRAEGDVALWLGTKRTYVDDKLVRESTWRRFQPYGAASYFAKRTRMGVVDYRIIEDNLGNVREKPDGSVVTLAERRAVVVEDGMGPGEDAVVFTPYNSGDSPRDDAFICAYTSMVRVGNNIAFTSMEKAEAGLGFV